LASSFDTSAHTPEQSVVPDGQTHCESTQTSRAAHSWAQRPQWFLSVVRSAQVVPHVVNPGAAHRTAHTPSLQSGADPLQPLPHDPQSVALVERSTHRPPHCV
jgi:hypothetical protein